MAQKHFKKSAETTPPPLRIMETPAYVRLGAKALHIDDDGTQRYMRPLLELRRARAEPVAGKYCVSVFWRQDFTDDTIIGDEPEASGSSGDSDERLTPDAASQKLIALMADWKKEGFTPDFLTPETKAAANSPSPT